MAWQQVVVQLAIVIASYAFTVSRTPKPTTPVVEEFKVPSPKSGQNATVYFGKNWVESPAILFIGNQYESPAKRRVG